MAQNYSSPIEPNPKLQVAPSSTIAEEGLPITGPVYRTASGWFIARASRIPNNGWNRQSIQIFADFSSFDSPRGSKSQRAVQNDHDLFEEDDLTIAAEHRGSSASSISSLEKPLPEPPYHVFTLAKKKQMVYIVSAAGIFSPLSSNIYFPALGRIATVGDCLPCTIAFINLLVQDLKVSISLVSLTITVYMIIQGIAPSFWGPYSDTIGRRPVFVATFITYLIANVGLAFSNNFATLMVFRGIQAAGSAATISIGKFSQAILQRFIVNANIRCWSNR